tara:strand:- start:367 stop:513 length:147 start_codon:yes stop_codon:yes gene_type:complete
MEVLDLKYAYDKGIGKALDKALHYSQNGELEKSKIVLETIKIIENHGV